MARLSCVVLLLGARTASATTATDTFTATLPTATETFTLPTTAATSTETYTLPTATFTLPTGGETATHTFTLPTSTATYDNKTWAPTKSPTSPTGSPSMSPSMSPSASPSGTSAPSASPSKEGDTHAPTDSPSKMGDTSAPVTPPKPTMSPSHTGDTSAPVMPTNQPLPPGVTMPPTKYPTKYPTVYPTLSPSQEGDTISPTTQRPTSSIDRGVMAQQLNDALDTPFTVPAYGGAGCTGFTTVQPALPAVQITAFTIIANHTTGVVYSLSLNIQVRSAQASDTEAASDTCASGGFSFVLRGSMTTLIGISPPERMPHDTMEFNDNAARRNRVLNSNAIVSVCDAVMPSGVCVTGHPTMSPFVHTPEPTRHHGGGDDDFPGWAIALCVVLPVLAIGAAVAVYFFVCNKGDKDAEDPEGNPNEPATDKPDDQM